MGVKTIIIISLIVSSLRFYYYLLVVLQFFLEYILGILNSNAVDLKNWLKIHASEVNVELISRVSNMMLKVSHMSCVVRKPAFCSMRKQRRRSASR